MTPSLPSSCLIITLLIMLSHKVVIGFSPMAISRSSHYDHPLDLLSGSHYSNGFRSSTRFSNWMTSSLEAGNNDMGGKYDPLSIRERMRRRRLEYEGSSSSQHDPGVQPDFPSGELNNGNNDDDRQEDVFQQQDSQQQKHQLPSLERSNLKWRKNRSMQRNVKPITLDPVAIREKMRRDNPGVPGLSSGELNDADDEIQQQKHQLPSSERSNSKWRKNRSMQRNVKPITLDPISIREKMRRARLQVEIDETESKTEHEVESEAEVESGSQDSVNLNPSEMKMVPIGNQDGLHDVGVSVELEAGIAQLEVVVPVDNVENADELRRAVELRRLLLDDRFVDGVDSCEDIEAEKQIAAEKQVLAEEAKLVRMAAARKTLEEERFIVEAMEAEKRAVAKKMELARVEAAIAAKEMELVRVEAVMKTVEEQKRADKTRQHIMVTRFELEAKEREIMAATEVLEVEKHAVHVRQSMMIARFEHEAKLRNTTKVLEIIKRTVDTRRKMMSRRFTAERRVYQEQMLAGAMVAEELALAEEAKLARMTAARKALEEERVIAEIVASEKRAIAKKVELARVEVVMKTIEKEKRAVKTRQHMMVTRFELEAKEREIMAATEVLEVEKHAVHIRQSMMVDRFEHEAKLRNAAKVLELVKRAVDTRRKMMSRRFNDVLRVRELMRLAEAMATEKRVLAEEAKLVRIAAARKSLEEEQFLLEMVTAEKRAVKLAKIDTVMKIIEEEKRAVKTSGNIMKMMEAKEREIMTATEALKIEKHAVHTRQRMMVSRFEHETKLRNATLAQEAVKRTVDARRKMMSRRFNDVSIVREQMRLTEVVAAEERAKIEEAELVSIATSKKSLEEERLIAEAVGVEKRAAAEEMELTRVKDTMKVIEEEKLDTIARENMMVARSELEKKVQETKREASDVEKRLEEKRQEMKIRRANHKARVREQLATIEAISEENKSLRDRVDAMINRVNHELSTSTTRPLGEETYERVKELDSETRLAIANELKLEQQDIKAKRDSLSDIQTDLETKLLDIMSNAATIDLLGKNNTVDDMNVNINVKPIDKNMSA